MNVIIKLKDYDLIGIDSKVEEDVESDWVWNGEESVLETTTKLYQYISFTFDRISPNKIYIKMNPETSSFAHVAEFFYGKDFSQITANKLITDFCDHVSGYVTGDHVPNWFEYVNELGGD